MFQRTLVEMMYHVPTPMERIELLRPNLMSNPLMQTPFERNQQLHDMQFKPNLVTNDLQTLFKKDVTGTFTNSLNPFNRF